MEGMELICFQIITANGTAKSCYMEALQKAKEGAFEEAAQLIADGDASAIEGHKIHTELLTKEAQGEETKFSLILMHAEDQAMSAELVKILVVELIELYHDRLNARKGQQYDKSE